MGGVAGIDNSMALWMPCLCYGCMDAVDWNGGWNGVIEWNGTATPTKLAW